MDAQTINSQKISIYSQEAVVADHARAFFRTTAVDREEGFIKLILDNLPSKPRARLLDMGCGIGGYAYLFKNNGLDVFAIDFSLPMCRYAKDKLNISCSVSDAEAIPFKRDSFDLVSAIGLTILEQSIYSWEYKEKIIGEIKSAIKDGGFLVLSIINKDSFINRLTQKSKTILNTSILVSWLKGRGINLNSEAIYGLPVKLIGLFPKNTFFRSMLTNISRNKYLGMRRIMIFKVNRD